MKKTLVFHASHKHFGADCFGLSREWGFEQAKVTSFDLVSEAMKFAKSIFNHTDEDAVLIRFGGQFDGFGNGTLLYRDRSEDIGEGHMRRIRVDGDRNALFHVMNVFMEREDIIGLTAIPMQDSEYQFVWFK